MIQSILLGSLVTVNILLALFIVARNYKNHINLSFSFFILSVILWMTTNHFSNLSTEFTSAFMLNKLIFMIGPYMVFALLYFSLVFPKYKLKYKIENILFLAFIPVLISNALTALNFVISDITFLPDGGTGVVFGFGIIPFTAQFLIYLLLSIVILFKKYKSSTGFEKAQLQYLLLGICFMMVIGTITNLIIPLAFNNYSATNFGPFSSIALVGFTSYAILKHRLLNIRLVVARTVAYGLLLISLAITYSALIFFISHSLFQREVDSAQSLIYAILALFVAFSFQPLKGYFEKATDSIFYKDKYESEAFLGKMSRIMSSNFELSSLSNNLLEGMINTLKTSKSAIVLTSNSTKVIQKERSGEKILSDKFESDEFKQLINEVAENSREQMLIFDELEESNQKEVMHKHNTSIVVALQAENEVVGGILLGEKSSGDMYSSQDIEVLKILAPEIAVAVKNALSTEEIKRFNVTLKEEIEKATTDLKKANNRLQQLDKLKDEFVSLASHELRTPLTVIKSYVWMILQEKHGKLNDEQRDQLQKTLFTSDHLIELVNDMLNISRIESGRMELKKAELNVKELINNIAEGMKQRAEELKISLITDEIGECVVNADANKIQQVIINLLGNSLKFTPEGGRVNIFTEDRGDKVVVGIKDTGVGIKKEDLPKLFQKFSTVGGNFTQRKNTQSTGLGLYLSKSIVELHGGEMWVESEGEGKGSTFYFSIKKASNKEPESKKSSS